MTRVIISHPHGGLLSLHAEETSLTLKQAYPKVFGQTPLFDPKNLLRLAERVSISKGAQTAVTTSAEDKKVEPRKVDGTTTITDKRPPRHQRRTHQKANKVDGATGGQNT